MKENIIYETKYWLVKLADNQCTIGRCVIDTKSDCGELSKLSKEEWDDFRVNVVVKLEFVMKKTFGATMFNWTCLMNSYFKKENPKPHVHFYFRPRYKNSVTFMGVTFIDKMFGHHYDKTIQNPVSEEVFLGIINEIKKNL
ncbi:hypothetical protein COU61_00190 [Candidatus Pacearchaeota archaeon CG10_big_fil_rev_8_21_14_0_10_35_13]|nr:MAG: hypothetical protein COU61_00190 [Candidatus Pacearchaeota archaeon CG10_big_fil_rev_8_21_14_0_10_35_13]